MRSNVYKSSIDAFLLTVDFSKLDEAWFAQFDQGGALSEEIQGLLKQCITDYQNFKQSINNPLAEIDPQNVLEDIKSRIESHKQQFDAVVSGGKEINFDRDVKSQLMIQSNKPMLDHNVLCYQLFLNSSLEQGRKNAFFKLIDNPSTLAALFSTKDLIDDQKRVAFG
ncbi:MAG: hypothetical protein FJ186_06020, partial [Gammaproteobacteria bacterium]|nr:hypothetical protein [Gammaproteobacteria bacterium]